MSCSPRPLGQHQSSDVDGVTVATCCTVDPTITVRNALEPRRIEPNPFDASRPRRSRQAFVIIAALGLLALLATLVGASREDNPTAEIRQANRDGSTGRPLTVDLIVEVVELGETTAATMECCHDIPRDPYQGTGWFAAVNDSGIHSVAAFVDELIATTPLVRDWLSGESCQVDTVDSAGTYMSVTGTWANFAVDTLLERDSPCGEQLWEIVGPLRGEFREPDAARTVESSIGQEVPGR